jgi:hypothetical protein
MVPGEQQETKMKKIVLAATLLAATIAPSFVTVANAYTTCRTTCTTWGDQQTCRTTCY